MRRLLIVAPVVLTGWIVYLIVELPTSYRAQDWDIAWIGFDIGMLVCLATTAWALWRRRQLAIPVAIISATFLLIDSWFDVVMSQRGSDFNLAIASAVLVELPLAVFLLHFSRRVIRQSLANAQRHAGVSVVTMSLIRTPLTIFDEE